MADLVVVPASLLPGDGAQLTNGIAGVAIAAGDVVTLDATTQRYILATTATVAGSRVRGIASCSAALGQPIRVQTAGIINFGTAILTVGELYVLSGLTPGKIGVLSDITAGDFLTLLGIGQTDSLMKMHFWLTEIARAV